MHIDYLSKFSSSSVMKLILSLTAFLAIAGNVMSQTVLIDEKFDEPNGQTYLYPPDPDTNFRRLNKAFAGWASEGGQLALTYGERLGMTDSGGLTCKVSHSTDGGGYLALNCGEFTVPVQSADDVASIIEGFQFEFDIKVPVGKTVNLFLQISDKMFPEDKETRAELARKSFGQKVVFPKIIGNDEYTHYSIKCSDLAPEEREKLVALVSECVAIGGVDINLGASWFLHGSEWKFDDEFSIDNIQVIQNH